MTILVTGGAGFIGSNFIIDWFSQSSEPVVNLDALTYAGNAQNLAHLHPENAYTFVHGSINDYECLCKILDEHHPRAIVNLAAESHVDRSIHGPESFLQTNVVGTCRLLEAARTYWQQLDGEGKEKFRFLHVSTDEVFGSLASGAPNFDEKHRYEPNSPYSASKAAGDHFVRAYHQTFGLPTLTTNCSNNYGPYQFPEKLIPLIIYNSVTNKSLPIYGDGMNVRDWIYVSDHCDAVRLILACGRVGETYNIGGVSERTNLDVVNAVCGVLDEIHPRKDGRSYKHQLTFVPDRPGHDRRYAIDGGKVAREFGWHPSETFESGIRKTVSWYLANWPWLESIVSGEYREWIRRNYGVRT